MQPLSNPFFFVRSFDIEWPISAEAIQIIKNWAELLLLKGIYAQKPHGVDFYLNLEFEEIEAKNQIIVTRWIDPAETSFYCITGWALYELLPWWRQMQANFELAGLNSWLPFPCVLISKSTLRRHADIGRPTALNYPVFGHQTMTGYFWPSLESAHDDYLCEYKYEPGKMLLLNTTAIHGGMPTNKESSDVRAILNMGFKESFNICEKVIESIRPETLFR